MEPNSQINPDSTYSVIELKKFGGELEISQRNFRQLLPHEILIKVMCTTMHPADMAFLNGQYGDVKPKTPLIPGIEGSGLIINVGDSVDKSIIGKRCGISVNTSRESAMEGLWAQYHYTSLECIMVFNSEVSYDKLCFAMGNPLTCCGFLDTIRKTSAKSVAQNGASSACGRIFIKLCKKEGVKTVNVVRKDEYINTLKSIGADYVYNSSNTGWEKEFNKTCNDLDVKNCFECVGGDSTGILLKALPDESTMYHFGNLALKRIGSLDTSDFIFKKKKMCGWWLLIWMKGLTNEEKQYWSGYITKEFESDSDVFTTNVSKAFNFEDFMQGFEYYLMNMSEGKIIIRPN